MTAGLCLSVMTFAPLRAPSVFSAFAFSLNNHATLFPNHYNYLVAWLFLTCQHQRRNHRNMHSPGPMPPSLFAKGFFNNQPAGVPSIL